jgi:hypothetical protein
MSMNQRWIYDNKSWHLIINGRTGCGIVIRPLLEAAAPLGEFPQEGSVCYICKLCSQVGSLNRDDVKVKVTR